MKYCCRLVMILPFLVVSLLTAPLTVPSPLPASVVADAPPPAFLGQIGSVGSAEREFLWPAGLVVDATDNIYVAERVGARIQKFDASGSFLLMWGWGVNDGTHEFQVCSSGCQSAISGSGDGQFDGPRAVAVDLAGNIYVVDSNNDRIQKFDSNANFVGKWGTSGSDKGEFSTPNGAAVDLSGNVYIADQGNHRIQKFSSTGTFLEMWGWGVQDGTAVLQTCTTVCQAGNSGSGDGQLSWPKGVAVDPAGNVFVSNPGSSLLQVFSSVGTFVTKWGGNGAGDGQFFQHQGVALDASGDVYVADGGNCRMQKFESDGTFITKWGTYGTGAGQFDNPNGVGVDSSGNVYVCDENNHRIQKFGPVLDFFIGDDEAGELR